MSSGPHATLPQPSRSDALLAWLFDQLWDQYRNRVEYVRVYEDVVRQAGATFHNDHIAFRTFAGQQPFCGTAALSRVFVALGYQHAGVYHFPDKHLDAIHFHPPQPVFPKLFISELRTWELPQEAREKVIAVTASHRELLSSETLAQLSDLRQVSQPQSTEEELQRRLLSWFCELPWDPPEADAVVAVNQVSQYAAWVLVHGYAVNHFTSLINSHGVESLSDIEKTVAALRAAGVPMKAEVEGQPGSKLRQTATEAVLVDVSVKRDGRRSTMPWSYAYFELAERGSVTSPESGEPVRFEGFLGPQATQLFEMTKVKGG